MFFLEHINTVVTLGISFFLFGISVLASNFLYKEYTFEKISSYECGFDAFSDARDPFDVKFYLIGILFILFDIEVLFFFPYIFTLSELFFSSSILMIIFIIILLVGFAYEWTLGCLQWD